jgi:hypothetical protein
MPCPYAFRTSRPVCAPAKGAAVLRPYGFVPVAAWAGLGPAPTSTTTVHHSLFAIRYSLSFSIRYSPFAIRRFSPFAIRYSRFAVRRCWRVAGKRQGGLRTRPYPDFTNCRSPLATRHSPLAARPSPSFSIRYSLFAIRRLSPFAIRHSPFAVSFRLPLAARRSLLAVLFIRRVVGRTVLCE